MEYVTEYVTEYATEREEVIDSVRGHMEYWLDGVCPEY